MRIVTAEQQIETTLHEIVDRSKNKLSAIFPTVNKIIRDIRKTGDEALLRFTKKFDKQSFTSSELKITKAEVANSYKKLGKNQIMALRNAAKHIEQFHKKQLKKDWSIDIEIGAVAGQVIRPLESIGVYAPGGRATYPSSVLMCAIPAKVAGVKRIVLCTPQKDGKLDPAILVAADMAGVTEIFQIGGAQAIAAMAYGTETIPKVDMIVGPGNNFVTAAKLAVIKDVKIDVPAGPSEILVIADDTGNIEYIASDLLAQAEHDPEAWAILLTTSQKLAESVEIELFRQVKPLSKKGIIQDSLDKHGIILVVENIEKIVKYANMIAPEHLQIQTRTPETVLNHIQNAGSVFLGPFSPVAFGDYSAGINHVLPTGGYAKIYSGLQTSDFVKSINFLKCDKQGFSNLNDVAVTLAKLEGFDAHEKSVTIRE